MIPLVDVVFQLILFFLVSTTFAVLPAITVTLPDAETAEAAAVGDLTVTVDSGGTLFLNGLTVTSAALSDALAALDTGPLPRSDYPVRLEADRNAPHGAVVAVLDTLRQHGFATVTLRTSE
jgi:biopolymer transport protein ExbD